MNKTFNAEDFEVKIDVVYKGTGKVVYSGSMDKNMTGEAVMDMVAAKFNHDEKNKSKRIKKKSTAI